MIAVPVVLAHLRGRDRPRRRSRPTAARPTAAASGRARRGSGCRAGWPGRRCRRPRAPRGCGTARPGSTTCRSSAYRRGGGPCWLTSLLQQQLDRQVEDAEDSGSDRARRTSRAAARPDPPPQGNERGAAAAAGRRRRPRPSPGAPAGRRAARRRRRPAAAAAPRTAARPARRAGRAGSARRRPGGPARWRARGRRAPARGGVRRPARAARPRSSTTPTRPVCGRARNRSTTPGRSTRRGSRRRARSLARKSGQLGAPVPKAPAAQVCASIVARSAPSTCTERPPPPGGRPSATQLTGVRRRQPRVAGQLVAGAERARFRRGCALTVGPRGDEVLGQQPGRDAQQLVVRQLGGVDGGRPEPARLVDPDQLQVRAGRDRAPTRRAPARPAPASGRPARLSRRSSSSCWAPGRNRPWSDASRRGPRPPRRRTARAQVRDPGPGRAAASWFIGAGSEPAWRPARSACRRGRGGARPRG